MDDERPASELRSEAAHERPRISFGCRRRWNSASEPQKEMPVFPGCQVLRPQETALRPRPVTAFSLAYAEVASTPRGPSLVVPLSCAAPYCLRTTRRVRS